MAQELDKTTMPDADAYELCASADGVQFYIHKDYGLDNLKRCQERSVEMLEHIVNVFERHKIDYFLAHGALLGKARHYLDYERKNKRDARELQELQQQMKSQTDEKICVGSKDTVIECAFELEGALPTQKGVFEGVEVALPANPDGILTVLYGNYGELPPVEERRTHFDKVVFLDQGMPDEGVVR